MIARVTRFILVGIVSAALLTDGADAQLDVGVTEGRADPVPIAVTDFNGVGPLADLGADIASVVKADLEFSGLFRAIPPGAFLQDPASLGEDAQPRFDLWRKSGAQALVTS